MFLYKVCSYNRCSYNRHLLYTPFPISSTVCGVQSLFNHGKNIAVYLRHLGSIRLKSMNFLNFGIPRGVNVFIYECANLKSQIAAEILSICKI